MTKLSININKIALIRNARGENLPDVLKFAKACNKLGVDGITVHPRPDERHITRKDIFDLAEFFPSKNCEYNIEGYPTKEFIKMVLSAKPTQCTLVPDKVSQLTSDHGWDTISNKNLLTKAISQLKENNIRVSIFIDPENEMIEGAKIAGADRIELYTGPYAVQYKKDKTKAIQSIKTASKFCNEIGIGINAGHDLNLENLKFLKENIDNLLEVSIGQAFVRDCLYLGIEKAINSYKNELV